MKSSTQEAIDRQREYWKSREKPLAEQSPGELVDDFEGMKDLTFVFIANSEEHGDQADFGHVDVDPALELAKCASPDYLRPRPFVFERETDENGTVESRKQIQREVETRVRILRSRPDTSFFLLWNIAGSTEVHCEASPDCDNRMIQAKLKSFFSELGYYI